MIPDVHKLDSAPDAGPVAPVPVRLTDVRFRYPKSDHDALGPVTLSVEPGEHVAITGPNGSGKTTLMLMLAGREPSSGTVERPGSVGLGRPGGTAVIMQHPESQVLGTRVADDVVWGLPPGHEHRRASTAHRGRPRRPGRTRHRRPLRRRTAAPRGGSGVGPRAVAADRRRGDQHGRPGRPRRR